MKITYYLFCFLLIAFIGCKGKNSTSRKHTPKRPETVKAPVNPKYTGLPLSSDDSLDLKIGQMIMIGINDRTSLNPDDSLVLELKDDKIGGIILFEKNIAKTNSRETLKKLIADLQKNSNIPLFISIDEEGGKVHRLKEKYGFVRMPSAAYLGTINNTDTTVYYTKNLAAQLADLGINLNYAPVVDLALNKDNPIIAKYGRSYSADPAIVTKHARTSIQTHHAYGVKTILKHFPGHGSSMSDSHLGITDVTNQWNIVELLPYKDLIQSGDVDAIMTAHIVNAHLDSTLLPATLSKTVITDVLRNMLEFKGVVFSDDMQMYAISKNYGLENSIKLSILAGVDVLVFGNNVTVTDRIKASDIHAIIKAMVKSGQISESRINESYQRIMQLKQKTF